MDRTVMYLKETLVQNAELFTLLKSGRVEAKIVLREISILNNRFSCVNHAQNNSIEKQQI